MSRRLLQVQRRLSRQILRGLLLRRQVRDYVNWCVVVPSDSSWLGFLATGTIAMRRTAAASAPLPTRARATGFDLLLLNIDSLVSLFVDHSSTVCFISLLSNVSLPTAAIRCRIAPHLAALAT